MDGKSLLDGIGFPKAKDVQTSVLNPTTTLRSSVDAMIKKYTNAAILSTTTVNGVSMSKVRGKDIYVLE